MEATMTQDSRTPTLDRVACPADLKRLNDDDLATLADELRSAAPAGIWGPLWAWSS
jgi:hypothetical protein